MSIYKIGEKMLSLSVIAEIIAEGNLEDVINNPKVKEAYFEG